MTFARPSLLASSALAVALALPFPARAQLSPQENPFNTVAGGAWVAAPLGDRNATWHNFSTQMKRSEDAMMLDGAGAPAGPLEMNFHLDRSANAIPRIATMAQAQYFPGQSVPAVETYLQARIRDYDAAMTAENLHAFNLINGCDYFVEGMYVSGSGVHVGGGDGRRNIRGACLVFMAFLEQHGYLQTNGARQALTQYFGAAGGTYRDMPEKLASDARATFRKIFNADIGAMPPERLPCAFATPSESCAKIMNVDLPKIDGLLARFG